MFKKEFGRPLSFLDLQISGMSVFVIPGGPLKHTWIYANELPLAGPLGSFWMGGEGGSCSYLKD